MTAGEIKAEIANNFGIPVEKVRCSRCAKWAYDNGGILTSTCSSRCARHKHKTDNNQFCRGFTPKEKDKTSKRAL